jgi:hypothetical protein
MSKTLVQAAIAAATLLAPAIASAQSAQAQGGYNRLMALDTDRNGALSHDEMETGRTAMFERVDTNDDGAISMAERNAARPAHQASGALAAGADANGDGSISRDEFMAQPYPAFDRFDADNNNVLDASELTAMRTQGADLLDRR